jgi:PPM family protein phosphatase
MYTPTFERPEDAEPTPLSVRSFGLTDPGRTRSTNEDQFLIAELTKAMTIAQASLPRPPAVVGEERGHLFLVADGMGGHNAGEQASALAVSMIEQFTVNAFKWFVQRNDPVSESATTEFNDAIQDADLAIIREAEHHPELHGMGTTLTLGYAVGAQLFVMHVGDSRAYLYRNGTLTQLTEDHTFVAELTRLGEIGPEQARRHPLRHVITNVLGGTEAGVRAEAHAIDLRPQDSLLLCSDGLTDMVSADDITGILAAEPEPEGACRQLVGLANDRGGRDNITVILAQFGFTESGSNRAAASP